MSNSHNTFALPAIIPNARSSLKQNAAIDPEIHLTRSRLTHKLCM
ncbi:hypothetical protein [Microcoleus sp. B13-B6]